MLAAHFLRRGYPLHILDKAYSRVCQFTRAQLLQMEEDPPFDSTENASDLKAFSITTFNPRGNPNKQLIKANWKLLGKSNTTQDLFNHRIIHGNRRCSNLRDILVHAKLKIQSGPRPSISGSQMTECTNIRCRYCPKMIKTGHITLPSTGKSFKCCKNISCNSSNLIFCLKCNHCQKLYVGQTKRPLKERLSEQFNDISKKDPTKPLGLHFSINGHPDISVLDIFVLKFIKAGPDSFRGQELRDFHELQWIHRLRTSLPYGLNSMD